MLQPLSDLPDEPDMRTRLLQALLTNPDAITWVGLTLAIPLGYLYYHRRFISPGYNRPPSGFATDMGTLVLRRTGSDPLFPAARRQEQEARREKWL